MPCSFRNLTIIYLSVLALLSAPQLVGSQMCVSNLRSHYFSPIQLEFLARLHINLIIQGQIERRQLMRGLVIVLVLNLMCKYIMFKPCMAIFSSDSLKSSPKHSLLFLGPCVLPLISQCFSKCYSHFHTVCTSLSNIVHGFLARF